MRGVNFPLLFRATFISSLAILQHKQQCRPEKSTGLIKATRNSSDQLEEIPAIELQIKAIVEAF